jgi:aminocarboxymuconate-semialdehyde decarboxylase
MIIDLHAHLNPMAWSQDRPGAMFDVKAYVEAQRETGVDLTVFSNPMIGRLPHLDLRTLDKIKIFHDFAAEVVSRYPENLAAFADGVPFAGDAFLEETVRAIEELGFKGVYVNSSVGGEYLDSPRAYPFYEQMCKMDVPVYVHPPGGTLGDQWMKEFRLVEMVGRPCDTTLSLARLIYFGVLEKYPGLKLICAHLGGAITMLAGRLDSGYLARHVNGFGSWGPDVLKKKPSEYVKMLYVDTVCWHQPALMCALQTVGEDHVVFGTDNPPVRHPPLRDSIGLIKNLPVSEGVKKKIFGENAKRLLHLR